MKLRLYHHPDGARIAYREAGTGPPLALLHSAGLTHREWEPVVDEIAHRYRVVLPDLPLHGDSEDRPRHPYTPEWLTALMAGFLADTCGPRPLVAGHGIGAVLALRAVATGQLRPEKLVLLPNPMHTKPAAGTLEKAGRVFVRAAVVPGCDRVLARAGRVVLRPSRGDRLTVTGADGARDLVRHAYMDLGGDRVRSWAKAARRWPRRPQRDLLDAYAEMTFPGAAAVGRRGRRAPARDRRGGAEAAARRAAARPAPHRLPDRLRRPGRSRPRAGQLLRVTPERGSARSRSRPMNPP